VSVSCIYEGAVRHRRFLTRSHAFRYRLALAYIDLDELPVLLGGRLTDPRPGLVRFRRRDYLPSTTPQEDRPLAEAVRELVRDRTGQRPGGPIRVLTQLRSFGHCFNPVSFYYCFDQADQRLEHVLAEVTNTPWGERHVYVLSASHEPATVSGSSAKELHVSPFMGMDHRYDWRVSAPDRRLEVHIESRRDGALAFDATLCMRRRALSTRSLARTTARYPFATVRVLALIYAQALRLKLKGAPVHPHPNATPRSA
jgi:uncharacterized protein